MCKELMILIMVLVLFAMIIGPAVKADTILKHGLNPIQKINPQAPKYPDLSAVEHNQPAFQKPASGIKEIETPQSLTPPQYFCDFIDYSGGAAAYYWLVPDNYNDIEMGMRFDSEVNYNCTLLTAWVGIYGSYMSQVPGTPDMRVTVYADDGFGLPGTALGSVVVPYENLPTSGLAYVAADLTSLGPLVFTDGESYHIGVSVDNFVDGDTLAILSDDGTAGDNRSWENWNGIYGFMSDDWSIDINFCIGVDFCCNLIPYNNCYTMDWSGPAYYYWNQPDAYDDDYFNMRFNSYYDADTLKEVGIALYGPATVGTPDLDIYVWGDDGSGFPDLSNEIVKVTIPFENLVFYPEYNIVDLSALNLIMYDDFFVGWSTNEISDPTGVLAGLSDDGSYGFNRSSEYSDGSWGSMLDDWGVDVNFLMYAYVCNDPQSECITVADACNLSYFWRLPDAYGDVGEYQKVSPSFSGDCRLEKCRVAFYWPSSESTLPLYTYNTAVQIWDSDGPDGLPGAKLTEVILTPADYILYPGMVEINLTDIPGFYNHFDHALWIGVESFAPSPDAGIRSLSDDGSCGDYNSCEAWYNGGTLIFGYMADDWSVDVNFIIETDICCEPLPPTPCWPGEDWPTMGQSFARTNRSLSQIAYDLQGNMTKAWEYAAGQVSNLNSPVVYIDTIVNYFLNQLVAIDLNDGSEIWKRLADGFEIGGGCYATPTIYNFAAYGEDVTLIFTPGGDAKSFSAINLTDGTTRWTRNYLAHSHHFMTWGVSVIVDIEGVPYVIYNDDNGDIYCVEALTGNIFSGWVASGAGNPVNLGGAIFKGLATDGYQIYIGTDDDVSNGDIYCLDAATGILVWQFADHQLCNLDPDNCGTEAFTGGIAHNYYYLYTASSYDQYTTYPPYRSGGIMYCIDMSTGNLGWAQRCNAQDYNGPALTTSRVINTGWNGWVSSGEFRGPVAFNNGTGSILWKNTTTNPGTGSQWLADGIVVCDPYLPDWYIVGNNSDFLDFYRENDGRQMFHRRFAGGHEYAHHYAPSAADGHLLYVYYNKLICMTEQTARPRLEIPKYTYDVPVEFGMPDGYTVVWEDAIGNNGNAPLTINSVTFNDDDNNTTPSKISMNTVDPDRVENLQRLAEKFSSGATEFRAMLTGDMERLSGLAVTPRLKSNHAAYTVPAWVYTSTITPVPGTIIPASGDYENPSYIDITVQVNATLIPRGYHAFYARIDTDDPDYFLDSARIDGGVYAIPQIRLGIIGGCLYDNVELSFGVGGTNYTTVWNSTKIGEEGTTEIDGDDVSVFQGAFVFAAPQSGTRPPGKSTVFSARVAFHCANWHGDPNDWQSILADINCYDGTCWPVQLANIYLGTISNDFGASYEDVFGEIACFAFVDSVADMCEYDTLGNCLSWDWLYQLDSHNGIQPPPSDTLTMGFHACATVIGVYDQSMLNNFVIYRFDFDGRYSPLNNIWMGAIMDYDINYPSDSKNQYVGFDTAHSLGFAYTANLNDNGWGLVKIPFGCPYQGMVNAKTLSAGQSVWNDSDVWLDSVYYWMSSLTGLSHQNGADPSQGMTDPDDREAFFTIAHLDMPAAPGTATVGVALFGLPEIENASDPATYFELADMANKWCGFGRGDVNNDGLIDLVDIAYLIDYIYCDGNGPYPFLHLGDVNADGTVDVMDINRLIDYYIYFSDCLEGKWEL